MQRPGQPCRFVSSQDAILAKSTEIIATLADIKDMALEVAKKASGVLDVLKCAFIGDLYAAIWDNVWPESSPPPCVPLCLRTLAMWLSVFCNHRFAAANGLLKTSLYIKCGTHYPQEVIK